jgi:excinuclease ABC subunit C
VNPPWHLRRARPEGPIKADYRASTARLTPGDDYAGIQQAVERRFARILRGEAPMPDLL